MRHKTAPPVARAKDGNSVGGSQAPEMPVDMGLTYLAASYIIMRWFQCRTKQAPEIPVDLGLTYLHGGIVYYALVPVLDEAFIHSFIHW